MDRPRDGEEAAKQSATAAEAGPRLLAPLAHLELGGYLLVPGDPGRVGIMAAQWDEAQEIQLARGFRAASGTYRGAPIAALSTGIGGPSLETVVNEAVALGFHTLLRVGTTGALDAELRCGDLVINDASIRLDGTSAAYARPEFPAAAAYEVTLALVQAAEGLGCRYRVGLGATTASLYAGQERPAAGGYRSPATDGLIAELQAAGVLNFEMEAATLFVLSRLFGLRAGAVCSVVANRVTGEWEDRGGVARACRVGAEAVRLLHDWDERKRRAGVDAYAPSLGSR